MKKFVFLFVVIFISSTFAQNNLRVEEFKINGFLKSDDPISSGLGRINAVKLNLNKGDRLYSRLTADFIPLLVLVPPSGEYKIMYPDEKTFAASFNGTIDETGQWLIYIVGDSTDTGKYTLANKYASVKSLDLKKAGSFCDKIKLLLNHEKAHFCFLKGKEIDDSGIWQSKLKFDNIISSEIYGIEKGWFKAVFNKYSDKKLANKEFLNISSKVEKCIGSGWNKKENDWHNVLGKESTNEKIVLYRESGNTKRYIKVILSEKILADAEKEYELSLIISELK